MYGRLNASCTSGLGSSTVDQVLKYTKYPEQLPSTSTGQVLFFLKYLNTSSTILILKLVLKSGWTYTMTMTMK